MPNLPVPYDREFAAWQSPGVTFYDPAAMAWRRLCLPDGPTLLGDDWWSQLRDPIYRRPLWYDRQGQPISVMRWGELREVGVDTDGHYGSTSYVRVGEDDVGEAHVSTVWLGHDHGFPSPGEKNYRPVIFETMIFGGEYTDYQRRYCTEEEAVRGHREAVEDLQMGMRPWWSHGGEEDDEWRWTSR